MGVVFDFAKNASGNYNLSRPERAEISLEYRASDDVYVISLPGYRPGELETTGYSGSYVEGSDTWQSVSGSINDLLDGNSGRQDAWISLRWPAGPLNPDNKLTYTSWGWGRDDPDVDGYAEAGNYGYFVYGIPTAKPDMPTTGSASYSAQVMGLTDQPYSRSSSGDYITGSAQLRFDFGAGTLSGEMRPEICPWDCLPLGTYTFVQTVYSTGSTSFSGQFAINGETVPSWFEGSFNGPQAAELMARWKAPYTYGDISGTMGGVWLGTKD